MNVVLLSARGRAGAPHWSTAAAGALAHELAAAGDRVRWLCALTPDDPAPVVPPGVALQVLRRRPPPLRRVAQHGIDTTVDAALARTLRPDPADVVLHVGFGAPGSLSTPWLAERMGSPPAAWVRAADVLCHRGTFVDAGGADCRAVLDVDRCRRCCRSPLLGALSPFPGVRAFAVRNEVALASLQACDPIVVADDEARELLRAAGVPVRSLHGAAAAASPIGAPVVAAALHAVHGAQQAL